MAVMNRTPSTPQRSDRIRYPEVDISGMMGSWSEIRPETASPARVIEAMMYVSVGKDEKESKSTLRWALHKSGGRKICILHVHQPAEKIPFMGTKFRASQLEEHQVRGHHDSEREKMLQLLEKYCATCQRAGVRAEKLYIEMDSIEKGIVELVLQNDIRELVMGAAADRLYSKRMLEPKSKKAMYVRLQAPSSCHIWFVCKGNLIYTREARLDGLDVGIASLSLQESTNTESQQSNSLRSRSVTEGQNGQQRVISPAHDYRRVVSDNNGRRMSVMSPSSSIGGSTLHNRSNACGTRDDLNEMSRGSSSTGSRFSTSSSTDVVEDSAPISYPLTQGSEIELDNNALSHFKEDLRHLSPPSVLERSMNDELYDQLVQAMAEAENSRRDAFEESIRCRKAEKDTLTAIRRAKASESSYSEELRRRREIEEEQARVKEECETIMQQLNEVKEELRGALDLKSSLESQIASSDLMVQELEQKMFSAVELLQNYKKELDELEVERDDLLRIAEELRKKQAEEVGSSTNLSPQYFSEFSFAEIVEATHNFDSSLKIGEGGYGSIYRAFLRHTQVAIKVLHSHSLQGPSEFQQEVNVLSKLRHPNLVTLIGACPEAWILIYEYLASGSLEDRLNCKDNTSPLSWQTRIRICAELCSILIFLHSCGVVHGDLKPANLLLDNNFVSKLSDFGICRVLSQNTLSSNNTTLCCRTDPKGTFAYIDPEFMETGELTKKSDVYSFGIILLRLLTGLPPLKIAKEVQAALDEGRLKNILDPTAGDWPFVQAKQLAHLGLSCCEKERRNRPDLASEVWRVLEPMKVSCGVSSFRLGSEERCHIPHYFICPIFQEIMQDPVVAADGFTYEAEAVKGWLASGHDTSPMTNLKLGHNILLPNHALRSAIQEWLQQP